jgi:hypothetical protein
LELTNQGAAANTNGQIDGCYDFEYDEADEMIKTHDDVLNITSQITMEAWIRPEGTQVQYAKIIQKLNDSNDQPYQIDFQGAANDTATIQIYDGTNVNQTWTTTEMNVQTWYYVAGVYDGTNLIAYVNDSQESSNNIGSQTITTNIQNLEIGGNSTGATGGFDGFIDEVRLSKIARNSSWINTTYNNTDNINNFIEFGDVEIQNVGPVQSSPSPSDGATGQNLNPTLSITVGDANLDAMNVTFWTNVTGSWGLIGYNDSVYNGTYSQTNDSMNIYGTTYWWSVNVTDYTAWTNATYSFTTSLAPLVLRISPNAAGRSMQLLGYGAGLNNYLFVDEVPDPNYDDDYVYSQNQPEWINDTYNLENHTIETGDINNITIYLCYNHSTMAGPGVPNEVKPVIYTNGEYYDSDAAVATGPNYANSSWVHPTNPITSSAWTWDEIDDLEVGVALIGTQSVYSKCTQVKVEVHYTPSA